MSEPAPKPKGQLLAFALGVANEPLAPVRSRLSWLLFFRGLVITVLLTATVGLRAGSGQPLLGTATVVLYVVCGLSYASILVGALWLKRYDTFGLIPLGYFQLLGDSVVAAVLVVATGGFESAFVFLFSLTVLNAAAVLGRRAALVLAGFNSLVYTALLVLQGGGLLIDLGLLPQAISAMFPSFLANILAFFLVALLSSSLTEQLRRTALSLTEARETLEEVEHLHETVLESLPSGVLTVGATGKITFVNRAGADILGTRREVLLGRDATEVIPDLPSEPVGGRFEVFLSQGRVLGGNVAHLGDASRGRVVVFQDLTELRQLQSDLARAERLQTLGRFAAGMAHELRNPLAAMIGCLQLLKADARAGVPITEEATRMLTIVDREATRLEGLVSDFLTYARPSPPSPAPVDLVELVRRCAQAAGADDDALELDLDEGSVFARCDADQIQQVLWNLIGNARQAVDGEMGPRSEAPPRIVVRVRQEGARAAVIVDDNGPGVVESDRPRLFEPFFTRRASGTGLGLATSHQLVSAQQGEILVGTSPLGGARFTLRLMATAAPKPVDDGHRPGESAVSAEVAGG